jgi:hypothetical protein
MPRLRFTPHRRHLHIVRSRIALLLWPLVLLLVLLVIFLVLLAAL